jgi:hypothetical protein
MYGIDSVAPTICSLMGVQPPRGSTAEPITQLLEEGRKTLGGEPVEKALLYAPDAIGEWLYQMHRDEFTGVLEAAPLEGAILSMTPSSTPVCYGSMFTGLKPEGHGIRKYEKPVLKCDTLFDALTRAGRKVAIVAVKESSIDLIFRGRPIDYHSMEYDPSVEEKVMELLKEEDHDLILAYHQGYDDAMHGSTPTSPEAIEAFKGHLRTFERFAEAFGERHGDRNRLIAFLPDHGTHVDPVSGKGSHGTDSPEDMEVRHFWGIYRG